LPQTASATPSRCHNRPDDWKIVLANTPNAAITARSLDTIGKFDLKTWAHSAPMVARTAASKNANEGRPPHASIA